VSPAPQDFSGAIGAYHAASWRVLNDPAVWHEEAQRADAPALPWPPTMPRTQYQRLLRLLVIADVDVVLALLRRKADPLASASLCNPCDPNLQIVLRVAHRAMVAGDAALVRAYGGERVTGKREYTNRTNEQWTALALRYARAQGLSRDHAFELFGIPRRQGFRAAKRATRKK
jgi:hypothetical protein